MKKIIIYQEELSLHGMILFFVGSLLYSSYKAVSDYRQ